MFLSDRPDLGQAPGVPLILQGARIREAEGLARREPLGSLSPWLAAILGFLAVVVLGGGARKEW